MLLKPPRNFKGDHDNIERFFGDCLAYFEVFQSYFQDGLSLKVAFMALHFEGPAQDWWIYKCQEFWTNSGWDAAPARFCYPEWDSFMGMVNTQFRDPAVEEVHEKRMFDLRMGNGTATAYFQRLEEEAKLVGL